jgi:hypothetical protein
MLSAVLFAFMCSAAVAAANSQVVVFCGPPPPAARSAPLLSKIVLEFLKILYFSG